MAKTGAELLAHYNLPVVQAPRFGAYHGNLLQAVFDRKGDLEPYIAGGGGDQVKVGRLVKVVEHAGQSLAYGDWIDVLVAYNTYTGKRVQELSPKGADKLPFWKQLVNSGKWTGRTDQVHVCSYLNNPDATTRLHAMWVALGSNHIGNVIGVIGTAIRLGAPVQYIYATLRAANVKAVLRLATLHPAGSEFRGYTKWGKGNHSTVKANIRWHFLKHVMAMSEAIDVDLDAPELIQARLYDRGALDDLLQHVRQLGSEVSTAESALWWRTLRIRLSWAEFVEHRSGWNYEHLEELFVDNPVTNVRELPYRNVARFLEGGTLSNHPRLTGFLVTKYENAYRDYALEQTREAGVVRIELEQYNAFVAGFTGSIYFVGRLDEEDDDNSIALSSCYICFDVQQKMATSKGKELWALG